MSKPAKTKNGFGIVGVGAAACFACCAGPILAILGGVTMAGVAGTMFVGAASLIIAVAAAVADLVVRRRRQAAACALAAAPVPVTVTAKPAPSDAPTELTSEGVR